MLIGITGPIGRGKSHTMIKAALYYAEQREKQLVFNFPINRRALYLVAQKLKYTWVQNLLLNGGVSEIVNPEELEALLLPGAVVCLDEAGVFLNSRKFAKTPTSLLSSLAQSRKGNKYTRGGTDLIFCAQFFEQVDRQLRDLTHYWLFCDSLVGFNKKEKRPELIWKHIFWFNSFDFKRWMSDPKANSSYLKTRFSYSFKYEQGIPNYIDKLVFQAYNSLGRVDGKLYFRIHSADSQPWPNPNPPRYFRYPGLSRPQPTF